jgi:DNA polymerase-3 subunit beta
VSALVLSVARSVLRDALSKVAPITESGRTSLLVRSHVLLEADANGTTITATNFDTFGRVALPARCETPGRVLVPAKRLAEIAASLPEGVPLTLTAATSAVTISAGRSRFQVATLGVNEFPLWPGVEGPSSTIPAAVFVDALSRCVKHASPEESRAGLQAVRISAANGQLVATACTGHHLLRLPLSGVTGLAECSIHAGTVPVLVKFFGGAGDDVTLDATTDDLRLQLASKSATLIVRLNEHLFPAVESILRQDVTHTVICDRASLLASFARVALGTGEDERVEVTINSTLALCAQNDTQRAEDVIEPESHDGPGELRLALNAGWVRTILANLTDERVRITLESARHAVHFRNASQSPDDPTIAMAMTLRTF